MLSDSETEGVEIVECREAVPKQSKRKEKIQLVQPSLIVESWEIGDEAEDLCFIASEIVIEETNEERSATELPLTITMVKNDGVKEPIPLKDKAKLLIDKRDFSALFSAFNVSKRNQKRLINFFSEPRKLDGSDQEEEAILVPKHQSKETVPLYQGERCLFTVVLDICSKTFSLEEAKEQSAPEVQIKPSLV